MRKLIRSVALVFAVMLLAAAASARTESGAALYAQRCSSCHGSGGQGSQSGPPLIGTSAVYVHFMLDTGRMPAAAPGVNEMHKPADFTSAQITAIVNYVSSFSETTNRTLPIVSGGNPVRGRTLFAENCAHCHGAVGNGASVGADDVAPSLMHATEMQVAEAVRAGPGIMPRFGTDVLSDRDVDDIARYVNEIQSGSGDARQLNAGGVSIAHVGPVAEGFIAWLLGLGTLLLFVRRIGTTN
ncbi:MAG: c-type cytochrome [Candidatus Eremiobacteraeota bacterium]|nr:c-type cytochrome [Candidatus Eremiobacteraeota bacterium]